MCASINFLNCMWSDTPLVINQTQHDEGKERSVVMKLAYGISCKPQPHQFSVSIFSTPFAVYLKRTAYPFSKYCQAEWKLLMNFFVRFQSHILHSRIEPVMVEKRTKRIPQRNTTHCLQSFSRQTLPRC
jgi:hypothetical protein